MKNDGQPIRDSVPWNSRCTKDLRWLNNVFLFSTEIGADQSKKITLYIRHAYNQPIWIGVATLQNKTFKINIRQLYFLDYQFGSQYSLSPYLRLHLVSWNWHDETQASDWQGFCIQWLVFRTQHIFLKYIFLLLFIFFFHIDNGTFVFSNVKEEVNEVVYNDEDEKWTHDINEYAV